MVRARLRGWGAQIGTAYGVGSSSLRQGWGICVGEVANTALPLQFRVRPAGPSCIGAMSYVHFEREVLRFACGQLSLAAQTSISSRSKL